MSTTELLVLSMALGMDLFSVAVPIGMNRIGRCVIVKASAVFALFHIAMLLSGYYIGNFLGVFVDKFGASSGSSTLMMENCASVVGAGVLVGLGVLMFREGLVPDSRAGGRDDILHGWALMVLAFSVSVDALAAGFGFGMMEVDLICLSAILGSVIFLISVAGLSVGRKAGAVLGNWAGVIGGSALILLGGNLLWRLLS